MHGSPDAGTEGSASPAAPPAGRSLVLSDVLLLTAESGGRVAVPGLSVIMDESSVTVRKPDGDVGAIVNWGDVSRLGVGGRMAAPLGDPIDGVIVEAVTAERTHRFVVPTEDPDGLEREIAQLASAVVPRRRRRWPWRRR